MPINQSLPLSFKAELLQGVHNFSVSGDTVKIALYVSSATLNALTPAYTPIGEVVGVGYTAGGVVIPNLGVGTSIEPNSFVAFLSWGQGMWLSSTFTTRGALIYNASKANRAIAVLDFGEDKTVSSGDFIVQFPPMNGMSAIIRLS